jgi:hypothetical protein
MVDRSIFFSTRCPSAVPWNGFWPRRFRIRIETAGLADCGAILFVDTAPVLWFPKPFSEIFF